MEGCEQNQRSSTVFKATAEELLNLKVVERAIREPKDPKEGFDKLYLRPEKRSVQRTDTGKTPVSSGADRASLSKISQNGGD